MTDPPASPCPVILGIDVGQKNLGACVWSPERGIVQWGVWDSDGTWASSISTALRANATEDFMRDVTDVVIEHQPSKNPTMTRIMHYLEFFFVDRGHRVHIQDSKHKLLYASTTPWFPKDSTDREWTYRYRKKLAVQTVQTYLELSQSSWLEMYAGHTKKDDLADSLLHAMAHQTFKSVTKSINAAAKPTKPTKLIARAPSAKQERQGRYSAHNVAYFLKECSTPDDVADALRQSPRLKRAFKKHFQSVDEFFERRSKKKATTL